MSMKRTVVLTAVSSSQHFRKNTTHSNSFDGKKHYRNDTVYDSGIKVNLNDNVNVVLAGALLSILTAIVCILCYFCNKSINKRSMAIYRQRWMESLNDPNMEVYSVEQFYDSTTSHATQNATHSQGEPPSYDTVMNMEKKLKDSEYFMKMYSVPPCQNYENMQWKTCACPLDNVEKEQERNEPLMGCEQNRDENGNNCMENLASGSECAYDSARSDKEENGMDENANQDVAACSSNNATSSRVRCENCEQLIMAPMDMENNPDTIDHLNGNGLVRMDMSKIIDSTGLPTYDAALKLESCGYV